MRKDAVFPIGTGLDLYLTCTRQPVIMTIQELLLDVGLPLKEIGLTLQEIKTHNELHCEKLVPELKLKESIDQILIVQLPFIGRTIASVKGDHFLYSNGRHPLSADDNALRYAAYKLDKYFRKSAKSSFKKN